MVLEFVDIRHAYGHKQVLDGIDLRAEAGDITCLLGQSGCGKTTLLRLAAGLLEVQTGEIRLNGKPLASKNLHPAPEKRPVGLVFQEGALFPHLTAAQNIGFGLGRGSDRERVVAELLDQVGLSHVAQAYPDRLSGGQQQRVALARALAPEPAVLLLDEPFASVDSVLRKALREQTRRLLKGRNAVAIMVSHDPAECLEMADKIAIMESGRIVQAGTAHELYHQPASVGIARLFGGGQLIKGEVTADGLRTPFGLWQVTCLTSDTTSGPLDLVARPSALKLAPGGDLKVEDVRPETMLESRVSLLAPSGERLTALSGRAATPELGSEVSVLPRPGSIFGFKAN